MSLWSVLWLTEISPIGNLRSKIHVLNVIDNLEIITCTQEQQGGRSSVGVNFTLSWILLASLCRLSCECSVVKMGRD